MKKTSTAAIKQRKNISRQKLTIGLDLGDRNCWYCVLDEAGQVQLEQRVRTNAKALGEVFGAMPCSRIALEIGTERKDSLLESADGSMATAANSAGKELCQRKQPRAHDESRIPLTPTGLLMEGRYTHCGRRANSREVLRDAG
jgi:hypothetical protein